MGRIALKFGPKVTYLKLLVLWPRVLGQFFNDLASKITYLNRDLGFLKPSKFVNWVQYQNLMLLKIFKIGQKLPKNGSQTNLSQAYSFIA